MLDLDRPLSPHFRLEELLHSDTAQRIPRLFEAQMNPPAGVIANLEHLAKTTLEPARVGIGMPIVITSGYRSPELNDLVGGSRTSQHPRGQAADCHLVLTGPAAAPLVKEIADAVRLRTSRALRSDVGADFLFFAWIALRLQDLDVDQLIHEFGSGPGRPAWVHVSSSPKSAPRRQILAIDRHGTRALGLAEALRLGT